MKSLAREVTTVPRGVFQGRNFMTPDVLSYYVTGHQGRTAYVEVSEGRGMDGGRIFGVTVRQMDGARFDPDPSSLEHSLEAVLLRILRLSGVDV